MKHCKKCDSQKSEAEFSKDSSKKDGLCSYCKKCSYSYVKEWKVSNPEKVKESQKKNYKYRYIKNGRKEKPLLTEGERKEKDKKKMDSYASFLSNRYR